MSQYDDDTEKYYSERCEDCGYPFFACTCPDVYEEETRAMEELASANGNETESECDPEIPF